MKPIVQSFHPDYTPREIQEIAFKGIEKGLTDHPNARILFLELPTGFGKSLMADAIIRHFGNGYVCTSTKQLQGQYEKIGFKTCKGRANFTCLVNGNTCDVGNCKINECDCDYKPTEGNSDVVNKESVAFITQGKTYYWKSEVHCPYWEQKADAINATHTVFNYKYMLGEMNYSRQFEGRNVIIADEGHNLDAEISSFIELEMSQKQLEFMQTFSGYSAPKFSKTKNDEPMSEVTVDAWIKYLSLIFNNKASIIANIIFAHELKFDKVKSSNYPLNTLMKRLQKDSNPEERDIKRVKALEYFDSVTEKIKNILDYYEKDKSNWIVEEEGDFVSRTVTSIKFKPVFIGEMANDIFFKHGIYCFVISATLYSEELSRKLLGLENKLVLYGRRKPVFPVENTPIYDLGIMRLNKDTFKDPNAVQRLLDNIDAICDLYPNSKGMIHATYEMSKYFKDCRNYKRFKIHNNTNREETLQDHILDNGNSILVSASMSEGVDLYEDLCRFQIIPKVQYKSMADPVIKRRMDKINGYLDKLAAISLAQSKGRGTRSEKDTCEVFLIDTNFNRLMTSNKEMLLLNTLPYVKDKFDFLLKHGEQMKKIADKYPDNLEWLY